MNFEVFKIHMFLHTSAQLGKHCSLSHQGFPCSSAGKESTCNVGDDPSLIPRLGRSPGKGIGYPPQYFWVSVVAQLIKYPSPVWETWVQSLVWEDPLEKRKATLSSILAWRYPWTVKSQKRLSDCHYHFHFTGACVTESLCYIPETNTTLNQLYSNIK